MSKEAMKLALEALEKLVRFESDSWEIGACRIVGQASRALREALADQPAQQEPFEYWNAVEGWVKIDEVREHFDSVGCGTIYKSAGEGRVPLTTAQRTWVGLTDEERIMCRSYDPEEAVAKTEAKLKEKNT
jgi:hypothetical protein